MSQATVKKTDKGYVVEQVLDGEKKPTVLGTYEQKKHAEEYAAVVNGEKSALDA